MKPIYGLYENAMILFVTEKKWISCQRNVTLMIRFGALQIYSCARIVQFISYNDDICSKIPGQTEHVKCNVRFVSSVH